MGLQIFAQSNISGNHNPIIKTDFKYEHYTTKQGLSQNAVYNILQDKKGFLWFCTQDGLNRFNGYEFTVFQHNTFDTTSLSHSFVNKVYEDSKGRIWVCTEGGLSLFIPQTESFANFTHTNFDSLSIIDNYIWTIYEDRNGTLWVGSRNGLSRFDPDKRTFELIKSSSNNKKKNTLKNISEIIEDENGSLWVGSRNWGIFKIIGNTEKNISKSKLTINNYQIGNNDVRSIIVNTLGNMFVGTFGTGLFRFDSEKNIFSKISVSQVRSQSIYPNKIISIFFDPVHPEILWLGTEEDGILITDLNRNVSNQMISDPNNPNSINGNMVYSFYRGQSSIMWIGTNEGVCKINLNQNKFEHLQFEKDNPNSLSSNEICKIIEDKNGLLWIGTDGGGLNTFNRSLNKFTRYKHINNNSISSNRALIVFEDNTGPIWVGTFGGGLNKFNKAEGTFESFTFNKSDTNSIGSDYVTSIVEDKAGYIWIGTTTGGLNRFDKKSKKFKRFMNNPEDSESISGNHIWILFIDKRGVLWAGTKSGGLNEMVDPINGRFRRFMHDDKNINGINHNSVHAIFEDHNGGFWIGTPAGLNKLDRSTGLFTDFQQNGVFPQMRVIGILEDNENRLWLMSEKSLIRFNSYTNEVKYYDSGNGMMINDFRIWANYKNKLGEMFVGGSNGLAIFQPDSLKDNSFVPPIVIDKFERFNTDNPSGFAIEEKGTAYRDNIKLSYKDNIFSFSFSALNYINSGRNQYAYKLEGFNNDWIKIGSQNKVTFTNIDPGSYTFRVKGSNDDGIWNEQGAAIGIIISPPFWITWWFRSGIFIIIISIIGSLIRNKLKAVENHHKEQEAFARQLIETEELERRRIANELHDSLGQNLLVIKNALLIKQQQEQIEGKSLFDTSELVSHTIQEVRTISHNLRPHLLDQLGLTKTIKSLAKQLNDSSGIIINAEVDDLNDILEPNAEINVFRIIQESFNNVIKHSGATKAYLKIKKYPDYLSVLIKDNGKGMNLEQIKKKENYGHGFGLYGMEKRAHVFNWFFEIDSVPNRGTEIKLTIPLKRN